VRFSLLEVGANLLPARGLGMPIVCSLARRRWTTRCMCCLRLRSPSNVWLSCTLASITSYCRISFAVTAQVVWLGLTQGVGILPSCCEQGMHRGYPSGLGGLLLGMWVRVESEGCLPAPCVGGLGDTLHPVLARINKQRHEVASSSRGWMPRPASGEFEAPAIPI
jgi:hypothetical protein